MTDRPAITTTQMQHLHALLRDHGISGDTAVHDWISAWLTENGEEPVESRRELAGVVAAKMIRDLEQAEVQEAPVANRRALNKLRAPFEDAAIGKLPRSTCRACSQSQRKRCDEHRWVTGCSECRGSHSSATMHIDYVGHADVTARLLEVDPTWTWEPMAIDPASGLPILDRSGGLWIKLTVAGVTRPGYGDGENGKGVKEAIGDALRNAAMRFGVALDLWAKGDRDWAHSEKWDATTTHPDEAPPQQPTPPEYRGPSTSQLLDQLEADAFRVGITREAITAKLRADLCSDMDVDRELTWDDLAGVDPWVIAPFAQAAHEHADKVVAKAAAEEAERAKAAAEQPAEQIAEAEARAAADPWATPA